MADDVFDPTTGATFATEEVAGRHFQLVRPNAHFGSLLLATASTVNAATYAAFHVLGDSASRATVPVGTYRIARIHVSCFDGIPLPGNLVVALAGHDPDTTPEFGNSDGDAFAPNDARAIAMVSVEVAPGENVFDQGLPVDPSIEHVLTVSRLTPTGEATEGAFATLRVWLVTKEAIDPSPFSASTLGVILVLERLGDVPTTFS